MGRIKIGNLNNNKNKRMSKKSTKYKQKLHVISQKQLTLKKRNNIKQKPADWLVQDQFPCKLTDEAFNMFKDMAKQHLKKVICGACNYAKHATRKTIKQKDVQLARDKVFI